MQDYSTEFTKLIGIKYPVICGAMYPCSNPELVAAASSAGGIGIVQPLSLTYVYGYDFRAGLKKISGLTDKPIGLNLLVEKSSSKYLEKSKEWLDIALDEGVRFFITALGNPNWVVDKVKKYNGIVFHDVTSLHWAKKALQAGVDGFIAVNNRAGGHAGELSQEQLITELRTLGKPVICAGGISTNTDLKHALSLGYQGVQLGTRFIASKECAAHEDYKKAICLASPEDIVLTYKISGVPVSVIKTPYIEAIGTEANWLFRRLLRHPKTKHWIRLYYTLVSLWQLKKSHLQGSNYKDYWQAGKSVYGVKNILSVDDIFSEILTENN